MLVLPPLDPAVLPACIRSRFIDRINGLRAHVLEPGEPGRPPPCIGSVRHFVRCPRHQPLVATIREVLAQVLDGRDLSGHVESV